MTDPFAEQLPRRDQYGRPYIKRPDGTEEPYTRISTLAGYIADKTAIHQWEKRCLAVGLGNDEELAGLAGSFGRLYDDIPKDDLYELDRVIEKAHDAAGGHDAAHYGTAWHRYTEPSRKTSPPARMQPSIDNYAEALKAGGWTVKGTEVFVVNHAFKIAGTLDHTVSRGQNKPIVLDKKTGKKRKDSWLIQLDAYSSCLRYDPETGDLAELGVNPDYGMIAWAPREDGTGKVDLLPYPLSIGHDGLLLALKVRDWRQAAAKVQPAQA